MSGGLPWYLEPRAMGSWQLRLMAAVGPLVAGGAGFVFGWALVHFPAGGEYPKMPTPGWLFWTGLVCVVAGVVAYAVARLTSPLYESDPDAPSVRAKPVRRITPLAVVCVVIFLSALVTCSIVSSASDYRWRPLWLIGVFVAVGLPIALLTPRDSV